LKEKATPLATRDGDDDGHSEDDPSRSATTAAAVTTAPCESSPYCAIPVEKFPALAGPTFAAVFKFTTEVEIAARRLPSGYTCRLIDYISDEIIDVWAALTDNDVQDFPEDNQEGLEALLEAFRPKELSVQVSFLERFSWTQPATGDPVPSATIFLRDFKRAINGMSIDETAAANIFVNCIRGNIGRILAQERKAAPFPNAQAAIKRFLALAIQVKRDRELLDQGRPVPLVPPANKGRSRPHPQPAPGIAIQHLPRLTEQERQQLRATGGCFRCRQLGHTYSECPNARGGHAEAPVAATASANQPRQSTFVRCSPRLNAGATTKPSAAGTATQPAKPTGAAPPPKKVNVIRSPTEALSRVRLHPQIRQGRIMVGPLAFADTFAEVSVCNASLAAQLGLEVSTVEPISLAVGDGFTVPTSRAANVEVSLVQSAPARRMTLYVADNIPDEDCVIIGLPDLQGYTITITDKPELLWHGEMDVEDIADPCHPPEINDRPKTESDPLTLIKYGDALKGEDLDRVKAVVDRHRDVFSRLDEEPARLPPFTVELLPDAKPVAMRPRYQTPARREFAAAELAWRLRMRFVEPSDSPWAAPTVITTKKDGQFRECQDYTEVNKVSRSDRWPAPDVTETLGFFRGAQFLASHDLVSGYNQIAVEPGSRAPLAYITTEGLYQPTRCRSAQRTRQPISSE